jgi:uncharacterized protein YcbK (DUF882 family)
MSSLPMAEPCECSRRRLLAALPALLLLPARAVAAVAPDRRLVLLNTHTGELLDTLYYRDGDYDAAEIGRLDWLLRDHRSGDVLAMERKLYDLLHDLSQAARVEPRYEIISGYRSPATNAKLAEKSDGVSSKSLHMQGRAIDVRLTGCPTADLRDLALAKRAGGVGYYQSSDFVHLDLGRVRSWSG